MREAEECRNGAFDNHSTIDFNDKKIQRLKVLIQYMVPLKGERSMEAEVNWIASFFFFFYLLVPWILK